MPRRPPTRPQPLLLLAGAAAVPSVQEGRAKLTSSKVQESGGRPPEEVAGMDAGASSAVAAAAASEGTAVTYPPGPPYEAVQASMSLDHEGVSGPLSHRVDDDGVADAVAAAARMETDTPGVSSRERPRMHDDGGGCVGVSNMQLDDRPAGASTVRGTIVGAAGSVVSGTASGCGDGGGHHRCFYTQLPRLVKMKGWSG